MTQEMVLWQERFSKAEKEIMPERDRMTRRERIYLGDHAVKNKSGEWKSGEALYVRNVAMELVEAQVDSSIPAPKVTALRAEDEELAEIIEDMLRDVMDRQPMERINDEAERVCPIQGGHGLLATWLTNASGKGWMGDLKISMLHPTAVLPQPGVYEVADMDYIFTETPMTKRQIEREYGVDLESENESTPQARSLEGSSADSTEIVTLRTAYYKNKDGGIGRFRWVNNTELENIEDYQVRRVMICKSCGTIGNGKKCTQCGGKKFTEEKQEYRELQRDYTTSLGKVIPCESPMRDEYGQIVTETIEEPRITDVLGTGAGFLPGMLPQPPVIMTQREKVITETTKIPYYKPDVYPIVMRKNVSQFGKFLGGSDIDAIEDQQNTLNKLNTKAQRKLFGGGSFTSVPKGMRMKLDDRDNQLLEVEDAKQMQLIKTFNTQVDIGTDVNYGNQIYEHARQIIGITDSFQGRKDATATSAVAKQFSAAQAAGRLESKAVMKRAMYADLFELIFKFMLAYCDEPRTVRARDRGNNGEIQYKVFDPMDFIYQDDAGSWHYNTEFLFSADSATPLASDRSAMWQEIRGLYESGAMGDNSNPETRIRFWTLMESLHYPMAGTLKKQLQDDLDKQNEMKEQMAQMPGALNEAQQLPGTTALPRGVMGL